MANGNLTSNGGYSSLKYTGSAITDRFNVTTANQELVIFKDRLDDKQLNLNSIVVSADDSDLYFSLLPKKSQEILPGDYNFTDSFVYFVEAGASITLSGLAVSGVKFSNALGARYFIMGMSF
jgi:hypothetical protein